LGKVMGYRPISLDHIRLGIKRTELAESRH
jgi:hypothetical protein